MADAKLGSSQAGEFENYTHTSNVYDDRRRPCGLSSVKAAIGVAAKNLQKEPKQVRLLDCGCGTGNYLNELYTEVGSAKGLEFNEGMLSQAKAKNMKGVVLEQGSVLDIKQSDASCDTVIMTQVLHHIESEHHQLAFDEMSRVLSTGGTLWLQTSFPQQIMEGFWWAPIIPQAAAIGASRFPGEPLLRRMLDRAGFEDIQIDVVTDEPLMGMQFYLDKEGPLNEEYRNGDSTWSRATPDELEAGLAWWRTQITKGTAEDFMKQRDVIRQKIGQSACVRAVKKRQGTKRTASSTSSSPGASRENN